MVINFQIWCPFCSLANLAAIIFTLVFGSKERYSIINQYDDTMNYNILCEVQFEYYLPNLHWIPWLILDGKNIRGSWWLKCAEENKPITQKCTCEKVVDVRNIYSPVKRKTVFWSPSFDGYIYVWTEYDKCMWLRVLQTDAPLLFQFILLIKILRPLPLEHSPTYSAYRCLITNRKHWLLCHIPNFMTIMKKIGYTYFHNATREMDKLKTHSPIYCN